MLLRRIGLDPVLGRDLRLPPQPPRLEVHGVEGVVPRADVHGVAHDGGGGGDRVAGGEQPRLAQGPDAGLGQRGAPREGVLGVVAVGGPVPRARGGGERRRRRHTRRGAPGRVGHRGGARQRRLGRCRRAATGQQGQRAHHERRQRSRQGSSRGAPAVRPGLGPHPPRGVVSRSPPWRARWTSDPCRVRGSPPVPTTERRWLRTGTGTPSWPGRRS